MTAPDTATQVRSIIAEHLSVADFEVTDAASLVDDLGADSLDVVEISIAIEAEFEVELDDEHVDHARTVGDIVKAVEAAGARLGA